LTFFQDQPSFEPVIAVSTRPIATPIGIPRRSQLPKSSQDPLDYTVGVKQRHNLYNPCQTRDRTYKAGPANLEAQQIQLFGGEPGDDVGLCYKMLEAFGRMEWIDTW